MQDTSSKDKRYSRFLAVFFALFLSVAMVVVQTPIPLANEQVNETDAQAVAVVDDAAIALVFATVAILTVGVVVIHAYTQADYSDGALNAYKSYLSFLALEGSVQYGMTVDRAKTILSNGAAKAKVTITDLQALGTSIVAWAATLSLPTVASSAPAAATQSYTLDSLWAYPINIEVSSGIQPGFSSCRDAAAAYYGSAYVGAGAQISFIDSDGVVNRYFFPITTTYQSLYVAYLNTDTFVSSCDVDSKFLSNRTATSYYWHQSGTSTPERWLISNWENSYSISSGTWDTICFSPDSTATLHLESSRGVGAFIWNASTGLVNAPTNTPVPIDVPGIGFGQLEGNPIDYLQKTGSELNYVGNDIVYNNDGVISDTGSVDVLNPTNEQLQDGITYPDVLDQTGAIPVTNSGTTTGELVDTATGAATGSTIADLLAAGTLAGLLSDVNIDTSHLDTDSNISFQDVFPFCVPFDLIALISVFNADPVAPSVTFPFPSVNGQTVDYTLDLSPFEPAAEILRKMNLILFICGLILATRELIRG